jgi:hypothetical protein
MACASHGHCPDWCNARGGQQTWGAWVCDDDEIVVCQSFEHSGYGTPFEQCADVAPKGALHCEARGPAASCTDGTACSTPSNEHCEGTRLVSCDQSTNLGVSKDCAADGQECMTFGEGIFTFAACVPPGTKPQCDRTYADHCDGNKIVFCFFGFVASVDCTLPPVEGTCAATSATSFDCVPSAHECTRDTPDRCDGTRFVTCGTNQKLYTVECPSIGFRTCGDVGGSAGCVN